MIVNCPGCSKNLKIPDNAGGKKVRCPACLTIISVSPPTIPKTPGSATTPTGRPAQNKRDSRLNPEESERPKGKTEPTPKSGPSTPRRRTASGSQPTESTSSPNASTPPRRTGTSAWRAAKSTQPSRKDRRKVEQIDEDLDADFETGVESTEADPWGTPSWDEPNPYAVASYPQSTSSSRNKASGGGLRIAGIGLLIQAWGYVILLGLLCVLVAFAFLAAFFLRNSTDAREVGMLTGGFAMLVLIPVVIAIFVGFVMCVFVPQTSGAQIPMIVALGISGLQVVSWIVQFAGAGVNSPTILIGIGIFKSLLGIAQIIFFCLFMKAAATWIRRDDLARTATVVMFGLSVGPFAGFFLMLIGGSLATAIHPIAGLLAMVVSGITGLVTIGFWVAHVALMFRLGTAMKNY